MPAQRYTAIYEDLKKKIEDGVYAPRTFIPPEMQLIEEYSCSRNTLRRALAKLAEIGYLQSIHGKGVVVIYQENTQSALSLGSLESLKEMARRSGKSFHTSVKLLRTLTADADLAADTGFPEGAQLYELFRVREYDGEAVILDLTYLLRPLVHDLTEKDAENSLYSFLEEKLGIHIVTSKRRLSVELADEADREYLQMDDLKQNCLAVVTAQTFNDEGVMFEYTQSRHRPDMFAFYTTAKRAKKR